MYLGLRKSAVLDAPRRVACWSLMTSCLLRAVGSMGLPVWQESPPVSVLFGISPLCPFDCFLCVVWVPSFRAKIRGVFKKYQEIRIADFHSQLMCLTIHCLTSQLIGCCLAHTRLVVFST